MISKENFVTEIYPVQSAEIKGIAAGLQIKGLGSAQYILRADDGSHQKAILDNILYISQCDVHLFCPQHLAACIKHQDCGFNSLRDIGLFTCYGKPISIPYHPQSVLPHYNDHIGNLGTQRFLHHSSVNHITQVTFIIAPNYGALV